MSPLVMNFQVNTSPFAGGGKFVTSRQVRSGHPNCWPA
jgi:predicted membrane GTPase involved in stress response